MGVRWVVYNNQSNTVVNVVNGDLPPDQNITVFLDPTGNTNVGDSFDPKDIRLNQTDAVIFQCLFILTNQVRALQGNSAITVAQFKNFVKTLF